MRHFLLISLLSLPLLATAAPAMQDPACENTTPGKRELHLIFENDVFSEKLGLAHSDRWYTSGVKAIGKINRSDPPWWYSASWEKIAGKDNNQYCMEYGFTLGQMMFTPMNIRVGDPQPNDRFWGGWLYVGTLLQSRPKLRADAKRGDVETFELDIGVVGPASLAQQSQKGVHALIGAPTPEGWHNQIKNELGVQVTYTRNFTFKEAHNNLLGFDLAAHYGFAAGTLFDYVNAGATIRIGNNLSGAPVGTIESPSLMAFEKPDNRAYLLARLDVRAQAHNTFVDGSILRRDPHVSYVHSKAIIVQATVGVVLEAKSWSTHRFAFLFHRRTSEFNTPPGAARMQSFGTMMMEVDF